MYLNKIRRNLINFSVNLNRKLSDIGNKNVLDTGIKIFSCKAKRKVPLVLKNPIYSSWYTCGPTTYDSAHIGHASTYVRIDIIQRILRDYFKVNLVTAMNVTNIDDKIIKRSLEVKKDWQLLASEYETEFWEDLNKLNVQQPDIKVRVTDKIPEIQKFIERILKSGMGYRADDGSVYFKTTFYKNYGKLQNLVMDDKEHEIKEATADFALWKGAKPGEPFWESDFGNGRPGWHIECSAMASQIFGNNLDFHAGGVDLKFPHHENEEAQSCVFHNVDDWVSYWVHTGHLHLPGQKDKMSKSLKNTVSIRDMLQQYSANQFRVACLLSHYRSNIEFGPELLTASETVLRRIQGFSNDSNAFIAGIKKSVAFDESVLERKFLNCQKEVDSAIKDDFNTAQAVGSVQDLMSTVNKIVNNQGSEIYEATPNLALVQSSLNYVENFFQMFGVQLATEDSGTSENSAKSENLINEIIRIRNEVRLKAKQTKNKELFKICDDIRESLATQQIEVKDHGDLSSWSFIKI
jgi:cysteinyl-tRNA synthetase